MNRRYVLSLSFAAIALSWARVLWGAFGSPHIAPADFSRLVLNIVLVKAVVFGVIVALLWAGGESLRGLGFVSPLPVLVKGVLAPADARAAADHGAAGVVVSNHGGRQLDGVPAPITMLPAIRDAVAGDIEILIDGGVRRGTDVLKALALGARAVMLGRPVLWGLTLDGSNGVRAVLEHIRYELDLAMALAGVADVGRVDPGIVMV